MSYDIYFIKKKYMNSENVYDVLEAEESNPDSEFYLSKDFMKSLIGKLKSEGLKFQIFEGKNKDYFELNFPTYQLSMFNSQIAISLPYWDENSSEGINKEFKLITNVFLKNDLVGFDPQTKGFISEPFVFQNIFQETKTVIDEKMNSETQQQNGNAFGYLGIGLGILIIGFLIWKMVNK